MIKILSFFIIFHICSASNESSVSNESNVTSIESLESNDIDFNRRIIGGKPAKPGEFPYVARLIITFPGGARSLCSSTILHGRIILTAAHCVYAGNGKKATSVTAQWGKSYYTFTSNEIFYHPGYNNSFADDIAVLIVSINRSPMTGFGTPPSLPNQAVVRDIFTNTAAIVAGYGKTSDRSRSGSTTLQYAQVNIISNSFCRYYYGRTVTDKILCTLNYRRGICGGDSGGPLLKNRSGKTYIIGVVAFGNVRCEAYSPGGYTNIWPYIIDWLSYFIN